MNTPQIPLGSIKLDQRAQPRASLNTETVAEYSEAMKAGAIFPPLTVFHDGRAYWLADGFHRHHAAVSAGFCDFACAVKDGLLRDAILYACQANSVHGLRRSDDDKRRAVVTLLEDREWGSWSDREIARRSNVSHPFVARVREERKFLTGNVSSETPQESGLSAENRTYRTRHGTVSQMRPATKIQDPQNTTLKNPTADVISDLASPYAALTFLAQSMYNVRATADEIVASCPDDEALDDLSQACEQAAAKLGDVLRVVGVAIDRKHAA